MIYLFGRDFLNLSRYFTLNRFERFWAWTRRKRNAHHVSVYSYLFTNEKVNQELSAMPDTASSDKSSIEPYKVISQESNLQKHKVQPVPELKLFHIFASVHVYSFLWCFQN